MKHKIAFFLIFLVTAAQAMQKNKFEPLERDIRTCRKLDLKLAFIEKADRYIAMNEDFLKTSETIGKPSPELQKKILEKADSARQELGKFKELIERHKNHYRTKLSFEDKLLEIEKHAKKLYLLKNDKDTSTINEVAWSVFRVHQAWLLTEKEKKRIKRLSSLFNQNKFN